MDISSIGGQASHSGGLSGSLQAQFYDWLQARKPQELEMLIDYEHKMRIVRQGDQSETGLAPAQKSRVFIGSTRGKIRAARAKIKDVLFGSGKMPFDSVPTQEDLSEYSDMVEKILTYQLDEMEWPVAIGRGVDDAATYGTAFMFGPFTRNESYDPPNPRLDGSGSNPASPQSMPYKAPYFERVSPMDVYPDPEAEDAQDGLGVYWASRRQPEFVRRLLGRPGYDDDAIRHALSQLITSRTDEGSDRTRDARQNLYRYTKDGRIWFLRYFGLVSVRELSEWRAKGAEAPDMGDVDQEERVEAIVQMAGGFVIKADINPYHEMRRPIYRCPYEDESGEMWGTGVARNNRDNQRVINAAFQLYLEGKAFSLLKMCSIDRSKFNEREDFKFFPGKKFDMKMNLSPEERKNAIIWHDMADVTAGWENAIELSEQFAEQDTGLTRYNQGTDADSANKMLDVNTPVPMADGSKKRMGDIVAGDRIIGSDGKPTGVLIAHEARVAPAFHMVFGSGEKITACGDHLWQVRTKVTDWHISSTSALYEYIHKYGNSVYIPRVARPEFDGGADLPIPPYVLGYWLGNGSRANNSVCTRDTEVMDIFRDLGVEIGVVTPAKNAVVFRMLGMTQALRDLEIIGNKHIPDIYARASYTNRLELLRGLMDSDGTVQHSSQAMWCQKQGRLADDVVNLIDGLGIWSCVRRIISVGGFTPPSGCQQLRITFSPHDNPFRIKRKADKLKPKKERLERQRIVSIEPALPVEMRCLTVDADDHLFCVGSKYTVTSNTATGISMIMSAAALPLKEVIANVDRFLISPMVNDLLQWDLEYLEPDTVRAQLGEEAARVWAEIKNYGRTSFVKLAPTGSGTFVMREVLIQKLTGFMTAALGNPLTAPLIDARELLQQVWDAAEIGKESPILPEQEAPPLGGPPAGAGAPQLAPPPQPALRSGSEVLQEQPTGQEIPGGPALPVG